MAFVKSISLGVPITTCPPTRHTGTSEVTEGASWTSGPDGRVPRGVALERALQSGAARRHAGRRHHHVVPAVEAAQGRDRRSVPGGPGPDRGGLHRADPVRRHHRRRRSARRGTGQGDAAAPRRARGPIDDGTLLYRVEFSPVQGSKGSATPPPGRPVLAYKTTFIAPTAS